MYGTQPVKSLPTKRKQMNVTHLKQRQMTSMTSPQDLKSVSRNGINHSIKYENGFLVWTGQVVMQQPLKRNLPATSLKTLDLKDYQLLGQQALLSMLQLMVWKQATEQLQEN